LNGHGARRAARSWSAAFMFSTCATSQIVPVM